MNNGAHVGSSVVIKGELSAKEDIRIAGRVEGRVDVEGFSMILEEGGELHADVAAAGIIVAGTVKGSFVAERRIELRSTASIHGDWSPDDPRRRRRAGDREDGDRGNAEKSRSLERPDAQGSLKQNEPAAPVERRALLRNPTIRETDGRSRPRVGLDDRRLPQG